MLWRTSDTPSEVRSLINIIKDKESTDDQVESATAKLMEIAEKRGVPSVIGDQLTYERASIGKQLRNGNITVIERISSSEVPLGHVSCTYGQA